MIRIAICDDNISLANSIENDISKIAEEQLSCEVFFSGVELIKYLESEHEPFNIYLMDIEMPVQNGIETASKIRETDKNAVIIFFTDFKEYVYQVFEVFPFRFLQKPVELSVLKRTVCDAINHIQKSKTLFFFQIGHGQMQRLVGEIVCFEGLGRKVIIHTLTEQLLFYGRITEIWKHLDQQLFTRPHASFLVNMEFIRAVKQDEIIVHNNKTVPISKRLRSNFKRDYMNFVERRNGII